jgi:RNA polymerase sigma-70 factor (ECF subfamily)
VDGRSRAKDDIADGTLGKVLYPDGCRSGASEDEWIALVRAVGAGDQLALQELYERTHRIVFTLAVRITMSPQSAEEVTVDVFHQLWRQAAEHDPEKGTVVAFIMNVTRSRALDRVRYEQRQKRVPDGTEGAAAPDAARGPGDALDKRQDAGRVRDALTCLTPAEREAIELAYFGELSYAETAARLGEPIGTIKTRIRSALAKLREALSTTCTHHDHPRFRRFRARRAARGSRGVGAP